VNDSTKEELLELTQKLLQSISSGDWETYQALCDPALTAFEPEGLGHLIEGMQFHRFYFDQGGHMGSHNNTIVSPHVRLLHDEVAVVSYVRLVRSIDGSNNAKTQRFEETRVWQKRDGKWKNVHFHRSSPG